MHYSSWKSRSNQCLALASNATIIVCSTVPAAFLTEIQTKLENINRPDIYLIDSPVSGGTVRAASGSLTILASGDPTALKHGNSILTELSEKLFIIPGGVGNASNVKVVNQLLAGVHIAAAAEAMGLAAKMGLNTRQVYESIIEGRGNSWMFENRVPHMLENDWHPRSALDIFVKDMVGISSRG
jgi:3-hydroxyisobutyrate dehydrogenase-like beta-hydroxyacid dehydrogenase